MLKKLLTLTIMTIALTVCVFVSGALGANAAQETLNVKSVDTTATSATLKLTGDAQTSFIYYSEKRNFVKAKIVSATGSTVKINGLKPETTYYFKAVSMEAKSANSKNDYISAKTSPVVSPSVDYSSIVTSAFRIEFKKNSECSGYRMWIADNKNFNGEYMTQGGSSLRFDYLKPNTTYYLKAYTYITINGKSYFSKPKMFTCKTKTLAKPTANLKASNSVESALRIEFNKASDVSGYRMWIADNKSFKGEYMTQGGSSLRFDYLKPDTTYYLKAYTYKTVKGKSYFSEPTIFTYSTKRLPKPSANLKASNSVADALRIEFNKVSGVSGYRMWIADNKNFNGEKMTQGGSSLRFDYLKPNTTYYLKAYTYKTIKGKSYFSEPEIFTYKTKLSPDAPTGVKATNGMYQISWNTWGPQYTISWNGVSGASSYNVYESSSRNGSFRRVGSVSGTAYTVTEPSIGDHYYIIKTVSGGAEGKASAVCGIRYVGIFSTTGYCANYGAQTADGSYCASGHTVAAGYAYAFGTYFKIGDHGYTYEVEDRGGAVSNSVIDIYFDSYAEACNWGRRWLPVYQIL